MREFLNGKRLANRVRMIRATNPSLAFLLVEGQTDKRFYAKFTDRLTCKIEPGCGKDNVKDAMVELNRTSFPGVLAIVDADFSHLSEESSEIPRLFVTDTHDIETMILKTSALDDIVAEYADEDKLANFLRNVNSDLRGFLVKNASIVGALRWIALRSNVPLGFDDIDYDACFARDSYSLDVKQLIHEVDRKRTLDSLERNALAKRVQGVLDAGHDPWQICCGHDLSALLSYILSNYIGSNNSRNLKTAGYLEGSLRLAFDTMHFQETRLYRLILEWEEREERYRVLPEKHPQVDKVNSA